MGISLFPQTDAALQAWSSNFFSILSTAAVGKYGVSAGQITAYGTVNSAFISALAACDPNLRNKSAVATKNQARTTLKNAAKLMANTINGVATVTVGEKIALGLNVRVKPTPAPVPAAAPGVTVKSVLAWTVNIRLFDTASSAKRGKPPRVSGAMIYSYVGAAPPVDMGAWTLEGMTGKTEQSITFANTNPGGTKVWFTAYWFNTRKQTGPMSVPITTNLQGGSVSMPMAMAKAA